MCPGRSARLLEDALGARHGYVGRLDRGSLEPRELAVADRAERVHDALRSLERDTTALRSGHRRGADHHAEEDLHLLNITQEGATCRNLSRQ